MSKVAPFPFHQETTIIIFFSISVKRCQFLIVALSHSLYTKLIFLMVFEHLLYIILVIRSSLGHGQPMRLCQPHLWRTLLFIIELLLLGQNHHPFQYWLGKGTFTNYVQKMSWLGGEMLSTLLASFFMEDRVLYNRVTLT